jgi:hypothetical protein
MKAPVYIDSKRVAEEAEHVPDEEVLEQEGVEEEEEAEGSYLESGVWGVEARKKGNRAKLAPGGGDSVDEEGIETAPMLDQLAREWTQEYTRLSDQGRLKLRAVEAGGEAIWRTHIDMLGKHTAALQENQGNTVKACRAKGAEMIDVMARFKAMESKLNSSHSTLKDEYIAQQKRLDEVTGRYDAQKAATDADAKTFAGLVDQAVLRSVVLRSAVLRIVNNPLPVLACG